MILIGKRELLFDITYFFGNHPVNRYFCQDEDFNTAHSLATLMDQVGQHQGNIVIITHLEEIVEKALLAEGFQVNSDYFFFSALRQAFVQAVTRQGCCASEAKNLWMIYNTIFYSPHGRYAPCHHPLYEAEITANGNIHTCCSAIMPFAIGNIQDTTIENIWRSPRAKLLRLSLLNGTAVFCTPEKCGLLRSGNSTSGNAIPQVSDYPLIMNIAVDATCNLSCASCRAGSLVEDRGSVQQKAQWLTNLDEPFYHNVTDIYVAGNGECMFSKVYKKYLLEEVMTKFQGNLHLVTNGQIWNDEIIDKITAKFCPEVLISIDAWKKETYEKLRCGGSYQKLLANIQKYVDLKDQGKLTAVVARFVVQVKNYREIPQFIVNMRKLGVTRIELTRLVNGGSFMAEDFENNSLLDENGIMQGKYRPFFAQSVWPHLNNDVFVDCAYLPK